MYWTISMEYSYIEYVEHIAGAVSPDGIIHAAREVRPLGKFIFEQGKPPTAVSYAGYTLITPPSADDAVNSKVYCLLEDVSRRFDHFTDRFGLVETDPRCRHMTIARLISGSTFVSRFSDRESEEQFRSDIETVLAAMQFRQPIRCSAAGITILGGGVIAVAVDFSSEQDFKAFHQFRDAVYTNARLLSYGVDRARPFRGHISLFYIEKSADDASRSELAETVASVNRQFFFTPVAFTVHRAELCRFDDFTAFYRKVGWPAHEFAPPREYPDYTPEQLWPVGESCINTLSGLDVFNA